MCEQSGSTEYDLLRDIASTGSSSNILVVGSTAGTWGIENLGGFDFAVCLLDTSVPTSTPPTNTLFPTQAPNPQRTPSLATTPLYATLTPLYGGATQNPSTTPLSTPVPSLNLSADVGATTSISSVNSLPMTTIIVALASVLLFVTFVGGGYLFSRRREEDDTASTSTHDEGNGRGGIDDHLSRAPSFASGASPSRPDRLERHKDGVVSSPIEQKGVVTTSVSLASPNTILNVSHGVERNVTNHPFQVSQNWPHVSREDGDGGSPGGHAPSVPTGINDSQKRSTGGSEEVVYATSETSENRISPIGRSRQPSRGIGVAQAVMGAAQELISISEIPGVAEIAGLVMILMNLAADSSDINAAGDYMMRRCRSVLVILQRAANVLDQVGYNLSCDDLTIMWILSPVYHVPVRNKQPAAYIWEHCSLLYYMWLCCLRVGC